jgi:hypothetical protein
MPGGQKIDGQRKPTTDKETMALQITNGQQVLTAYALDTSEKHIADKEFSKRQK